MTFQNAKEHNLYWFSARTNAQLHAWCLENDINLPKRSRKSVFISALRDRMAECGIDFTKTADYKRATYVGK